MSEEKNNHCVIKIRLSPRSSINEIIGIENNFIKIKVTSPPIDGKANKALIQLLAKRFKIPKRDIEIKAGVNSRYKTVSVKGLAEQEILKHLGV